MKKSRKIKKISYSIISLLIIFNSSIYASNSSDSAEVEAPVAINDDATSQGIIYHENEFREYNPLNPIPVGIDIEEYNSVDNNIISFNTLESRIKYFSPDYLNIKKGAESSYWMAFYATGGSMYTLNNYKDFNQDYLNLAVEYKDIRNQYRNEINNLDKNDSNYNENYEKYSMLEQESDIYYQTYLAGYHTANAASVNIMANLGYRNSLLNISNIDDNSSIVYARQLITKNLSSAILSYLQLESYIELLELQEKVYKDIYTKNLNNYYMGIATSLEVSNSLSNYENAKTNLKTTKSSLESVKMQIANSLGYYPSDYDNLVFVEPEVDLAYIQNINLDYDKERAYNSNTAYNSIQISEKDKKLPGSTGEYLVDIHRKSTAEKVQVKLEELYFNLQSALIKYQGCQNLVSVYKLNEQSNLRKKNNDLISQSEYEALKLQNLALMLEVETSKYDLIRATNEYYYGVLGHIAVT